VDHRPHDRLVRGAGRRPRRGLAADRAVIEVLRRDGRPWRIGHRGAAALAPGNTLASLTRALAENVDTVEFDVLDLADGALVLAHSDDLHDVSGGRVRGSVRDRTLPELRALIPDLATLDDALGLLVDRAPATGLQVDLKSTGYERRAVEALRAHGLVERALVSSVFPESLRSVAAVEPDVRLALAHPFDRLGLSRHRILAPAAGVAVLAMRLALPSRVAAWIDRTGASVLSLQWMLVSRRVVDRCHERGVAVWAWTVDSRRVAARLAAAGVDGIITNDPRRLWVP
jgi:glycerophosphoryl diester phosphodiesterase